ncbi:MAG: O-antigen ligase family protein, partial [Caldilinea sp.]
VAWLALAQPRVGLGLAAALLPFYYQHKELALGGLYWTVPPAHLLVLALLPAALAALGQPGARRRAGWAAAPAALLIPLSLLSATSVWHWPAFGRGLLDLVLVPALLGLEVGLLAPAAADRRRLLLALFGGGVLAAGVGLAHWAGQQGTEVDGLRRLVGPHFSPNHTALYLERTLMVGVAALSLCARPGRWWLGGGTAGVAVALWLTGSRGALLLGVPAGLAVLAVAWRGGRQTLLAAFGAGLLGLALFWLGGQERLVNWETVGLRWQLWQASWALWQDHFWAGVGPGGFFWQYPAYLPAGAAEVDVSHPHNFWLELATTWGVGGLLWGALVGGAFVRALGRQWRAGGEQRWIAVGVGAGCAAGLAHGQSDAFLLWADLA